MLRKTLKKVVPRESNACYSTVVHIKVYVKLKSADPRKVLSLLTMADLLMRKRRSPLWKDRQLLSVSPATEWVLMARTFAGAVCVCVCVCVWGGGGGGGGGGGEVRVERGKY